LVCKGTRATGGGLLVNLVRRKKHSENQGGAPAGKKDREECWDRGSWEGTEGTEGKASLLGKDGQRGTVQQNLGRAQRGRKSDL